MSFGTTSELPIPVSPAESGLPSSDALTQAFLAVHKAKYGHADPSAAIEIVNVRLLARALRPETKPSAPERSRTSTPRRVPPAGKTHRVWLGPDEPHDARIIERPGLRPGDILTMPTIVTQFDATTFLPTGCRLIVLDGGSLLIEVAP